MRIWVSGSIARDLIMDFPGRFRDFIDPKKIHVLNLSFAVDNLKENFGGTGANIAYNLALLGDRPNLVGNLGQDQIGLQDYFRKLGIETRSIKISKYRGAAAYIITDKDDNQITGFHAGAMNEIRRALPSARKGDWAIIAAENPKNMVNLAKYYQRIGVNYIFDPGQQITALSRQDLKTAIAGARVLIGNDYEIGLISKRVKEVNRIITVRAKSRTVSDGKFNFSTGSKNKFSLIVVRTLGPKGSEIFAAGKRIKIGIAKPKRILDPTGAGDAYRAGFLKGLVLGYNLKTCGQLGATLASFAVEGYGTQNHRFSKKDVQTRYVENFRELISLPR